MATKLTKAQLIERLTQVEAQCAAFERERDAALQQMDGLDQCLEEARAVREERDALLVAQRPSRHIVPIAQPHEHLVRISGVLCRKVITHNGFSTRARYVPA